MHTNQHELSNSQEVFDIVGCAMEVSNVLRHGLLEKPYENALCTEMRLRQIPFAQQRSYDILYKDTHVGQYQPDLVVFNTVIVEIKAISQITDVEVAQVLNYLKITGLKIGVILNFKKPKLEWKRVVL